MDTSTINSPENSGTLVFVLEIGMRVSWVAFLFALSHEDIERKSCTFWQLHTEMIFLEAADFV